LKLFNEGDGGLKSIFQISLADNPFHKLISTIEMVSYTTSKTTEIKREKKMEERSIKELVGSTEK